MMFPILDLPPDDWRRLEPLALYDHAPSFPYQIEVVGQGYLLDACNVPEGFQVYACSKPELGLIYIDERLHGAAFAKILRHERAHLNGWKHWEPLTFVAAAIAKALP